MSKSVCTLAFLSVLLPRVVLGADSWFEIKSPHFTVWSSTDSRDVRTLVWQLEQIRSAMAAVWPWARVDLPRPFLVIAARDEREMRSLVPRYWEVRDGIRPVSVWGGASHSHYLVVRADIRGKDNATENPHQSAYFSYVSLVLQANFPRELPIWLGNGLAGVMSNTIVRDDYVLIGPPIPEHLRFLREPGSRSVAQLLKVTGDSPQYQQTEGRQRFDALSWAFVHFLMFGENGAHASKIGSLTALLRRGTDPDAAVAETLGPLQSYDTPFSRYIERNLFTYVKANIDADVARERFAATPIPEADASAGLAAFQIAMNRPTEASALLAQARKANPNAAGVSAVEGLQAERAGDTDTARTAYRTAVERDVTSGYVHYRYALMTWQSSPDEAALAQIEKSLARAVELNPTFAAAHAALGEVRGVLGRPMAQIMPVLARAIALEPGSPWHRISTARTLARLKQYDEARKTAQAALEMATTEQARAAAQAVLAQLDRIGGR